MFTSQIIPTNPTIGNATTESVRQNFLYAKQEIEELQNNQSQKTKVFTAAENMSAQRAVYLSTTGLRVAGTDTKEKSEAIGITTNSALTGEFVKVQLQDELIEPTWSWTQGASIWLSTNGLLSQSVSSSIAQTELGLALTPTKILIRIQPPIHLI
jgi:hypothetical protein